MKCLLLLLLIVQVLAFTPFSMKGRGIRTITSRVTMSMVEDKIVNSPKAQVLKYVKDRSEGRDDLDLFFEGDAAEADSETASYDDFQSADSIETNPPKVGETITGTVIEMDDNGALLSITGK